MDAPPSTRQPNERPGGGVDLAGHLPGEAELHDLVGRLRRRARGDRRLRRERGRAAARAGSAAAGRSAPESPPRRSRAWRRESRRRPAGSGPGLRERALGLAGHVRVAVRVERDAVSFVACRSRRGTWTSAASCRRAASRTRRAPAPLVACAALTVGSRRSVVRPATTTCPSLSTATASALSTSPPPRNCAPASVPGRRQARDERVHRPVQRRRRREVGGLRRAGHDRGAGRAVATPVAWSLLVPPR